MTVNIENSVQINDGLTQTSADGACLSFDSKYGIMFCAYMPGLQGNYGESRGKISLSYFPASQPTNIKFVDISEGNDEYLPNILGLGDGRVRVFYEKFSKSEGDHPLCYKDFDFLSDTLGEEKQVMVKTSDGETVPYSLSVVFAYLEENGLSEHICVKSEQIGCSTPFRAEDGCVYGAAVSYLSEVALFKSFDDMATLEFFAAFPKQAQYEFDYRIADGKIHAIYRTNKELGSIYYTSSSDMGKTWKEPLSFENSIQCRPRIFSSGGKLFAAYNYYNDDTGTRPKIQQGRTSVKICSVEGENPNENAVLLDMHSKYGIVNVCLCDVLGDIYMAYSSSPLALEYQNGNPLVRGKDSVRYIKLGNPDE